MKKVQSPSDEYRNGYVRADPQNPAAEQIAVIEASGPVSGKKGKLRIENPKGFEIRDLIVRTIREAELLVVSELHRLGVSREDLLAVLREVEEKGAVVLEAETGKRSDKPAQFFEAILAFLAYYEVRRLSRADARKAGRAGAQERWGNKEEKLPPLATISAIWNDHRKYPKAADALAEINRGVRKKKDRLTRSTLHSWNEKGKFERFPLLPRPTGRPRKST